MFGQCLRLSQDKDLVEGRAITLRERPEKIQLDKCDKIFNMQDLTSQAKKIAYALGFDLVSVSSADPLEEDRDRYKSWTDKGYAAELHYMTRENPRRWVPQDLMPEARSVITFALNFFASVPRAESKRGFGRVARYAWGKDYHIVVKARLEEWSEQFRKIAGPSTKIKILVDSGPLLERAFAGKSGLGFVGKNTMIISRKLGSFIFLSEVLTDAELTPDPIQESLPNQKDACGACRECIADCPTGALVAPRQLDAKKCISYWTIENRGEIPEELRSQIGDWIFGCDICQEVCPYNVLNKESQWKEFLPESGAGPHLPLLEVLKIETDAEFKKKFEGTPILRAKRAGLMRNACVVTANQKLEEAIPLLAWLAENDPEPMVRSHALWSLKEIRKS